MVCISIPRFFRNGNSRPSGVTCTAIRRRPVVRPRLGTSTAVAYDKIKDVMNYVQSLGGPCPTGSYRHRSSIWYGWREVSPGFAALDTLWHSPCNHQAAYSVWLDSPFVGVREIAQFQQHITNDHQLSLPVVTELYSSEDLGNKRQLYAPYQLVVTGVWGAPTVLAWAKELLSKWKDTLMKPDQLAV